MGILDFTEIPAANRPGGEQDAFELFARDFLEFLGFHVLSGPDRGADGGRDLIAEELRTGVGGDTRVRWLVSCKHYAHSGSSVGVSDEPSITDRLRAHDCTGFICVYSTVASSSLAKRLEQCRLEHKIYDGRRIEGLLLGTAPGVQLAQRYFQDSIIKWKTAEASIGRSVPATLVGLPYPKKGNDTFLPINTWDVIAVENDVELPFWRADTILGVARLYCRTAQDVGWLANLKLNEKDLKFTHCADFAPERWRLFVTSMDPQDPWGVIKLQFRARKRWHVSLYRINYARCDYLIAKLREFLGDWDNGIQ